MALKRHQLKKLRILTKKVKLFDNDHLIKCKIKQADLWMWEDSSEMSEALVALFNAELEHRINYIRQYHGSWRNYNGGDEQWFKDMKKLERRFKEALEF